jgi:hypothetical protein
MLVKSTGNQEMCGLNSTFIAVYLIIGQYRAREAHKINPYFSISGF